MSKIYALAAQSENEILEFFKSRPYRQLALISQSSQRAFYPKIKALLAEKVDFILMKQTPLNVDFSDEAPFSRRKVYDEVLFLCSPNYYRFALRLVQKYFITLPDLILPYSEEKLCMKLEAEQLFLKPLLFQTYPLFSSPLIEGLIKILQAYSLQEEKISSPFLNFYLGKNFSKNLEPGLFSYKSQIDVSSYYEKISKLKPKLCSISLIDYKVEGSFSLLCEPKLYLMQIWQRFFRKRCQFKQLLEGFDYLENGWIFSLPPFEELVEDYRKADSKIEELAAKPLEELSRIITLLQLEIPPFPPLDFKEEMAQELKNYLPSQALTQRHLAEFKQLYSIACSVQK